MASVEMDPDLEALRSAVLATRKQKNSHLESSQDVSRTDSELEELRKAALLSTKKQNESSFKRSFPKVDFGMKKYNRNANLIVIQPVVEEQKSFTHSARLMRPQDAYIRLEADTTRSPEQQPRTKGTDKFSRFVSSSSSEDESEFSDSESTASDKVSETSENKTSNEPEESGTVDDSADVLVLEPDETFDDNIDKIDEEPVCKNGKQNDREARDFVKNDERTLNNRNVEPERKRDKRVHRGSELDDVKKKLKDDSDRGGDRKRRNHQDRYRLGSDRRPHRKRRERRVEERTRDESSARSKGDEGRLKLPSISLKSDANDRKITGRLSPRSGSVRSKSLERSSRTSELHDLRDKLQSRKRTSNEVTKSGEEKEEFEEENPAKRRSRGVSEERRRKSKSRSKSPPIKSVLSVVKVTTSTTSSAVVDSSHSRKRTFEDAVVNSPSKTNSSADSLKVYSPIRCEPSSPERKVLIRSRHSHNFPSEADENVPGESRVHSKVSEEATKNKDLSETGSQSPKPKLPVHLRLGNLPSASSNNHFLKVHVHERKRKSTSPSKPTSDASKSGGDRVSTTRSRQIKLSGERVRSITSILSKQTNDRLSTNKIHQLTGKTFENELDEKIRRIRVNNLAIMKRKSEIEREQHSSR